MAPARMAALRLAMAPAAKPLPPSSPRVETVPPKSGGRVRFGQTSILRSDPAGCDGSVAGPRFSYSGPLGTPQFSVLGVFCVFCCIMRRDPVFFTDL